MQLMATVIGCIVGITALTNSTSASQPSPLPTYYLRGYYNINSQRPVWQESNDSPWSQVQSTESWIDRRLIKWGYVPFSHDSSNFYCLIDDKPRTGSHVADTTFICGHPSIVESLFLQNNWRPNIPMVGGGPPLENSLRPPRPPMSN